MRKTHRALFYHAVFSTRERAAMIASGWRNRLHAYIGGVVKTLGGTPLQIGGTADHIHILMGLNATHCLADVVREIKKTLSQRVHETLHETSFAWQEGYSAFTVSATACSALTRYIAEQEEHHRTRPFWEEFVAMLKKAGIEVNEHASA